jgi:CelD/BcsL family acetyltransferase involved in cellulose biosynthesis
MPDIASLQAAWEGIFLARANEPSTSFEWTSAMLRHHAAGDQCLLMRLTRDGRDVGFVPLLALTSKILGQPLTTLAPISELSNTHSDLLVSEANADVVEAFVSELFQLGVRWDRLRLSKLLEDNPLLDLLERSLRRRGALFHLRQGQPAYVLRLPASFDEYLAERSAKFRNFLKRLERRIHTVGDPQVITLTDAAMFDRLYEDLLRIERASWKQEHGTSITAVARQTGFYREMSRGALAAGRLHLHMLMLGGVPVAYDLGYIVGNGYYYLKTSYDHSQRHVSPATFLRARLIEELIGRGITLFDFPGEPYDWERQWTENVRWHKTLSVYPATVKGRVLAGIDRLRRRSNSERVVRHIDPRALRPTPEMPADAR